MKRIQNHDVPHGLLRRDSAILIACSGGPDSIALLHILLFLRNKLRLRLGVAHVNYGIRELDADSDEALVKSICTKHELPFHVLRPRGARGKNEEMLRDIRYRFFDRIRKSESFDTVAVAHTEDDQAETVLIRLIRGSGPEGLSAMKERNGSVIRPLLDISKQELLTFLHDEHIPFHEDTTNQDTTILRNRIRFNLIPLLEREYRAGIRTVLARAARLLETGTPSSDLPQIGLQMIEMPGGYMFSRSAFLSFPKTQRALELRRLYRIITRTVKNPSESYILEIIKLIDSTKGKVRTYRSKLLKIEAKGDRITIIRA